MHPDDAECMRPYLWARIDTARGVIRASDETEVPYTLERRRRWSIGLRRYTASLSGRIVVHTPDRNTYKIVDCWYEAILQAEQWRAEVANTRSIVA